MPPLIPTLVAADAGSRVRIAVFGAGPALLGRGIRDPGPRGAGASGAGP